MILKKRDELEEQALLGAAKSDLMLVIHMYVSLQNYKDTLQSQILKSAGRQQNPVQFGADLSVEELNHFQDEQIGQLYELMLESSKVTRQFDIQEDNN